MTSTATDRNNNMNHVFLLGTGFNRGITEEVIGKKALLTDEIMPKLDLSGFPEIIGDYEETFPDIEQFITQLDLKCLRFDKNNESLAKRLNEIRDNIVEQIVRMFDVDVLSVDNLDNFPTLKKFTDSIPAHSTILTLNYDCVLDQGLWFNNNKWHPGGGYYISSFPSSDDENKKKDNILLLKLHGSCNFRKSAIGDNEYPVVEINDKIFSNIHTSHGAVQDAGAHVLVMSYFKIYCNGIMQLWRKAVESLKDADRLTIIGCSLREEDTFLKFALYHFGMKENTTKFYIDIIDKDIENCKHIENKVMSLVACPDKQEPRSYAGLGEYLERGNG
jgi:hypothetical protein